MAISNYYRNPAASHLTIFVETSPGMFAAEVNANANVLVSSTGTSQVAAAVPVATGRYCSGWTNGGSVTPYGVSTRTGSSNQVAYPSVGTGGGVQLTVTDAHGTHGGSVSGSYVAGCAVGVTHLATDSGWTFLGWKVTRVAASDAAGKILSTGGTASGAETTFPANYGAAVVVQMGGSSSYPLTIEAVYQQDVPGQYTVSFDKVSSDVTGADIPAISVAQGSSVILPSAGLWQRSGHDFSGWSTTSGGAAQYLAGDSYTPTGNVTLYAVWSPTTGGSGAQPDAYSTSDSLSREYYTDRYRFAVSTNVPTSSVQVDYWTRLQGSWISRHLSYSPNNNPNPQVTITTNIPQGQASEQSATLQAGSTDLSAAASGTDIRIPGQYINYYSYARSNNGSPYYTANDTTRATSIGADWEWTAPDVQGYEFDGWYTLGQSWNSSHTPTNGEFTVKLGSDKTIPFADILAGANSVLISSGNTGNATYRFYKNYVQARYQGVQVMVLLDAQGGELDDFYRLLRYSQAYGSLPVPTRQGYTFDGWYTAANGGTEVTSSTVVTTTTDHTLYAHWSGSGSAGTYKLYFIPNGGTCATASKDVTAGSAYGALPTPSRPGYSFQGWYTLPSGGNAVSTATVAGDSDAAVYARWLGSAYIVTFDPNGGTCGESTRTVYAGNPIGALPAPTKEGSGFDGWLASGGTAINASTVIESSMTVTARWTSGSSSRVIVRYKIRFELDGGTLDSTYECKYTRGYAKALPTSDQVTKAGYAFGGWYATAGFSGSPVTSIPTTASGTKTYYAKWL